MKFSAWYGITVGLLMILQWISMLLFGSVPELQSAPWAIAFHLAAELCTALVLIVGGISALNAKISGERILLVALGMVVYSEIVSPGYYAQLGQWSFVVMFGLLLAGAIIATALLVRRRAWLD